MYARLTAALAATSMLVFAACSTQPATEPAEEVRTIEVLATDALRFEPAEIQANVGETIRFVVTNQGATDHEFTVGDDSTVGMMSGGTMTPMEGMDGMQHGEGVASVPLPGNGTAELTLTFEEAGSIPFACHVNGHDEAGMVGAITVT